LVTKPVPEQQVDRDQMVGLLLSSRISANEESFPLRLFVVKRLCAGSKSGPHRLLRQTAGWHATCYLN
jgi:hypothetical protein